MDCMFWQICNISPQSKILTRATNTHAGKTKLIRGFKMEHRRITDEENISLAILTTEFKEFMKRYDRDERNAQEWRTKFDEKLEEKLIKPCYGNGKPGYFTIIDRLVQWNKDVRWVLGTLIVLVVPVLGKIIVGWVRGQ